MRLVLCDLGGTLVDPVPAIWASVRAVVEGTPAEVTGARHRLAGADR